jgi:hypothetical protein
MRLQRSLRPLRLLRLLRSLRPLRLLMPVTQYAKCKLSLSVKRHKRAQNVRKNIENIFTLGTFKLFFAYFFSAPFLLEAVENRDVTFNKIKGS